LTIDPSNPDNLWILTSGGLPNMWRSRDGGVSWELLTVPTLASALAIHQVVVDAHDSHHVLARAAWMFWQSFDGGDTWTSHQIGTEDLFSFDGGFAIAVDSKRIYAGEQQSCPRTSACSGGGLWKSTDGGTTWTLSLKNQTVGQIAVDPFNEDTVYAVVYQKSATKLGAGTLMRSRDGGRTWSALSPLACANPDSACRATDSYLLVEKTSSSTLYFAGPDGLLVSHDQGDSWSLSATGIGLPTPDPSESGFLYANLGEPPTTPPILPGLPLPPPPDTQVYGVVRSTDFGRNWKPLFSSSGGALLIDSRRSFYRISSTGIFRYTLVVPRRHASK
jgi:hypothetical protein